MKLKENGLQPKDQVTAYFIVEQIMTRSYWNTKKLKSIVKNLDKDQYPTRVSM